MASQWPLTTPKWYQPPILGSAPGDDECANNPNREIYGVAPCFGRIYMWNPPPRFNSKTATVAHRNNGSPMAWGNPEEGFTMATIKWTDCLWVADLSLPLGRSWSDYWSVSTLVYFLGFQPSNRRTDTLLQITPCRSAAYKERFSAEKWNSSIDARRSYGSR